MIWFGPTQFSIFRIILGIYLTIHFSQLLGVSIELFSNEGVIGDSTLLPTYGKLPIYLFNHATPENVRYFICSLIIASVMFTFGILRRLSSLWLYYGWMTLLNRNPLIANPSLGYIGWILLACSVIPKGERLGFLLSKKQRDEEEKRNYRWEMPDILYYGMWIIIGVSYTASGIHKLQCETWIDGTALWYVLTGPLARQNNIIVKILINNINILKFMTWGSLFLEISCLFLGTFYRTRKYYWIAFMAFHLGIMSTVNFADLTIGMLMAHLFTFDASWFDITKYYTKKYDIRNREVKTFDINKTDKFNSKPLKENFKNITKNYTEKYTKLTISSDESIIKQFKHWIDIIEYVMVFSGIVLIGYGIMSALGYHINFYASIVRITEITVDMYWGFGFLVCTLFLMMILERIFPDQELNYIPGWWKWVMIINVFQLLAVVLATFTWENWLQHTSYFTSTAGFHLRDHVSPFWGGVIAYIINQWLFYHWHKARHEVYFLWVLFHQFHHSPSRIETITSFYKHPLEIIVDSQIMAILVYSVLGLTSEASIWLSIFSGIGEYFYHMNIKTPQFIGYFFQRPESHRCHHRYMKRTQTPNYSDFVLWDILGGTFENPEIMNERTGFSLQYETKRIDMLFFKDVITGIHQNVFSDYKKFKKTCIRAFWYVLVIWGTLNSTAFIAHNDSVKEIGFVTVSSPLPLVFSAFNGYETFATSFNLTITYQNNTIITKSLDANIYNKMTGAYNRRNVYGAIFSHGPFFDKSNLIRIRQTVLNYAVCSPGIIAQEFGLITHNNDVKYGHVDVFYRSKYNKLIGSLDIDCSV